MRLDGFLAQSFGLSRKASKQAIREGRVTCDQVVVQDAGARVDPDMQVCLDGRPAQLPGERYLMLNKPAGVVTATRDANQPVVLDLLPAEYARGLHPAGRLDKDTTGLLLLTTDGQWSHRVTSPRRQCPKTYRALLAEPITPEACQQLEEGVLLKGESQPTREAVAVAVDENTVDLTIHEGRYHQVKRMFAATGNRVIRLHRYRIGDIHLDPALGPGEFRSLTPAEIDSFNGN